MVRTLSRPPLTRPTTLLTAFLAVLTVLATGVKSSPPATGPAPVPPPAAQPTAYPAMIEFEVINRSAFEVMPGVFSWVFSSNPYSFDMDILTDNPTAGEVGGSTGLRSGKTVQNARRCSAAADDAFRRLSNQPLRGSVA